jgi:hypothetical protein
LLPAAPSEPKPLFSAEYLADRELNRTGHTPADLQSALSATAHKKKKAKGSSRQKSVIKAFNPVDNAATTVTSSGSITDPQDNLTRTSDPSEVSSGEHAVVGIVHHRQHGRGGVRGAKGDVESGLALDRAPSGRGLALPFTPMAVAFKDISYFVPHPQVSVGADAMCPAGKGSGLKESKRSGKNLESVDSQSAVAFTEALGSSFGESAPTSSHTACTGALCCDYRDHVAVTRETMLCCACAGVQGQGELHLLHNITGSFRPGVLTALMGVSGEQTRVGLQQASFLL